MVHICWNHKYNSSASISFISAGLIFIKVLLRDQHYIRQWNMSYNFWYLIGLKKITHTKVSKYLVKPFSDVTRAVWFEGKIKCCTTGYNVNSLWTQTSMICLLKTQLFQVWVVMKHLSVKIRFFENQVRLSVNFSLQTTKYVQSIDQRATWALSIELLNLL